MVSMKEFNREELSKFDGKDGRPAYIAIHGWVIDVSESKLWKNGLHMKRHNAGKDLTLDIKAAPHTMENLARFPKVGFLKKEVPEREVPRIITSLIRRYPMLRRHPHPMTVHFPIVFMFATAIFNLIYLITGIKAFEMTALHCLGAGILFTPVTITTGFYTWWLNYMAKPVRAVTIKKRLSLLLFTIEIVVFVWRILVPDILDSFGVTSAIYFLLVLSLLLLVIIIGWFGAQLTFPVEEE
jgi:predicted heme/steroid binding protein/uncharacterized membrane protein